MKLLCLLLSFFGFAVPRVASAVGIFLSLPGSTVPLTGLTVVAGEDITLAVSVSGVPSQGLAAFQFDLLFDFEVVNLFNPNEAFRGFVDPFAPLGGNPFCTTVRGGAVCDDPAWFLTSTGRSAFGTDTIDNEAGLINVANGTSGPQPPPTGDGTIALINVFGVEAGSTVLTLSNVILGDNGEPPMAYTSTPTNLLVQVPEPSTATLVLCGLLLLNSSTQPARRGSDPPRRKNRIVGANPL